MEPVSFEPRRGKECWCSNFSRPMLWLAPRLKTETPKAAKLKQRWRIIFKNCGPRMEIRPQCHTFICATVLVPVERKFKDILDCGQHLLDVSTRQECQWTSAASSSMDPQGRTVCHQLCLTAACHRIHLSGGWKLICLNCRERHSAPFWRVSAILALHVHVTTYLLTVIYRHLSYTYEFFKTIFSRALLLCWCRCCCYRAVCSRDRL